MHGCSGRETRYRQGALQCVRLNTERTINPSISLLRFTALILAVIVHCLAGAGSLQDAHAAMDKRDYAAAKTILEPSAKVDFDEVRISGGPELAVVTAFTYSGISAEGERLRSMQNRLTCSA